MTDNLRRRPRLYLHVGPAKTGTSAVQIALRDHDDPVVLYPRIGLWHDGAHHSLVFNFYPHLRYPGGEALDMDAAFARIGEQARDTGRSIVISSEALFAEDVAPFMDGLTDAVGIGHEDVEILVVYREPFARAASTYNQSVKEEAGCDRRLPDEFLSEEAERMIYAPALERLARTGAGISILGYEPVDGFVGRFLAHLGFPPEREPPDERHNLSLSVAGLIATLAANRVAESFGERAAMFEALSRMDDFYGSTRFIFGREAALAVEPIFAADRRELAERWGFVAPPIDLSGRQSAFRLEPDEEARIEAACADLPEPWRAALRVQIGEIQARPT